MSKDKYLRVGTTLYKLVQKPLISGDSLEVKIPWKYETLRQDHTKDFMCGIPKYDGFCTVPSHINYKKEIGNFLNEYEPIESKPKDGKCPTIIAFLEHIFKEQLEYGLDYIQLLYTKPLIRLPILLLVSQERNTGKTTFLNFLKSIFGNNMTFNTNEDFRSQFNSDWANKLIVAVDEVLLSRAEDSEKIKNLSTAKTYKSEAKGKDRFEIEFFAKFILCSNNEHNPIVIGIGETRYWVRKIHPFKSENENMLNDLKSEIPQFLNLLMKRKISTYHESRMWFKRNLLDTDALKKIVKNNRNKAELELAYFISEIMESKGLSIYHFCIKDIMKLLDYTTIKLDRTYLVRTLKDNWNIQPQENSITYTTYFYKLDGSLFEKKDVGRYYSITQNKINTLI